MSLKNIKHITQSVYRLQDIPVSDFIDKFKELLSTHAVLNKDFRIAGDAKIHLETNEISAQKCKHLIVRYE